MTKPDQLYHCLTPACDYIYDPNNEEGGIFRGILFEDLPEDWRCPHCGAGKKMFRRLRQPKTKEERADGRLALSLAKI